MNILKPEILSYKVVNDNIYITAKARNVHARGLGLYLRFKLAYTKQADSVSICKQSLIFERGNPQPEYVYYETTCHSDFFPTDKINKVTVNVASNIN